MLYLIEPLSATPLCAVLPDGTTNDVAASILTFLPELGLIFKSLISVEISAPNNLKSPLITSGHVLLGPTLSSWISSNSNGATPNPQNVSTAVPLARAPDVCIG